MACNEYRDRSVRMVTGFNAPLVLEINICMDIIETEVNEFDWHALQ